jgi:hypothetical protein
MADDSPRRGGGDAAAAITVVDVSTPSPTRARWEFPSPPRATRPRRTSGDELANVRMRASKLERCMELASLCHEELKKAHLDEKSVEEAKRVITGIVTNLSVDKAPNIAAMMTNLHTWLSKFSRTNDASGARLHIDVDTGRHAPMVSPIGCCYMESTITVEEAKARLDACFKNIVGLVSDSHDTRPVVVLSVTPSASACGIGQVCLEGNGVVSEEVNTLLTSWVAAVNKFKHDNSLLLREVHLKVGLHTTDAAIFTMPR